MMEQMNREVVKMWKASWDGYVKMLKMYQAQGESMVELLLDGSGGVNEETKKMVKEGLAEARNAQDKYFEVVDENFKRLEELLGMEQ